MTVATSSVKEPRSSESTVAGSAGGGGGGGVRRFEDVEDQWVLSYVLAPPEVTDRWVDFVG